MPVDVDGLDDVFDELDDLKDDYGSRTGDWVVPNSKVFKLVAESYATWRDRTKTARLNALVATADFRAI